MLHRYVDVVSLSFDFPCFITLMLIAGMCENNDAVSLIISLCAILAILMLTLIADALIVIFIVFSTDTSFSRADRMYGK